MRKTRRGARRHVAYCDVHVPHEIPFGPILDFQHDYAPTDIIINGDFLNLEHASHWNERVFKRKGDVEIGKALRGELGADKIGAGKINGVED